MQAGDLCSLSDCNALFYITLDQALSPVAYKPSTSLILQLS